ncbi:gluconate transporter [Endozoicomonas montiporae]|uniref:Gluconate transporter n=2 Tax=Endozoicomonas montiporae TaxID=1027273 RepID=A0A081N4N3_9GAMM|nr:GntP family permease [Endozoicomonas montiporae]AMO57715.1 gluconate transporter [Endozoicomonas montiporae CL-33]KEQ13406.1 gluconate transporter [Endozoicomonas montiporae]
MYLVLILIAVVAFVVIATSRYKLHPFITLLLAAFATALLARMPLSDIAPTISAGFGGILGSIGIVIILGTLIGTILEKTGAAITMADSIIKLLGERFPKLTMSIIGYLVSIPVFCDSGYVILNSLKHSVGKRLNVSAVGMSVALATGLYATHTFVPPTPGPIAAAGNLGLMENLGLVIGLGSIVAACTALAGLFWASKATKHLTCEEDQEVVESYEELKAQYGELPSPAKAFAPIMVPIVLICLASIANYPTKPFGNGNSFQLLLLFLGTPLNALMVGLGLAVTLIRGEKRTKQFTDLIGASILACAPILLITGAGGAFGRVLSSTDIGTYLGEALSGLGIGIFMPFVVAAALKTAQGSSTVALVTTSVLVAPMLGDIGLASEMGRALTVLAIGAGAMTVSHANDSFFWVVSQFSKMNVGTAYKAQTMATLVQGITGIAVVYMMSLVLL